MRFDQTKFLARNIDSLSDFYLDALDCEVVVPKQTVEEAVSRAIRAPDATVT